MKKLTQQDKIDLAVKYGVKDESVNKVVKVESGGKALDETTKKLIIQFKPF